ncbi:hypothetical protein F5Y05DRAFT_423441 [Hypoxylon sp. FL0543]|nr:hypothetical protein F5Y05DRAFT_423441 [Hypoxylon sp. FL0543]
MLPSPSRDSGSRSSQSVDRELKHRKRYSLRIEFLDDEDDEVDDRKKGGDDQPGRSTRSPPTSRRRADEDTGHLRQAGRQSRRASLDSTTAVVGHRNLPSKSARTPQSKRDRRESTRSGSMRPSSHRVIDDGTAAELEEAFDHHMSLRDRDEAELPRDFERQLSIQDRGDPRERSSSSKQSRKKPSYRHAYAQTDMKGLGSHVAFNPFYPAPALGSQFARTPGFGEAHLNAEMAAYNNGFLLGRQLASSQLLQQQNYGARTPPPPPPPSVASSSCHPDIQPPQPLPVQRPSISTSSSLRPASVHDRIRGQSRSNREHRKLSEEKQQPQGWRFNFPNWVSLGRREPSPPPRSGSRSSGRSHRR